MRNHGTIRRWTRNAHAAPWAWSVSHDGHVWADGHAATQERALKRVLALIEGEQ